MKETYLTHYLKQSCGWVKIAEYTCKDEADADKREAAIRSEFPQDEVRFERRTVTFTVRA